MSQLRNPAIIAFVAILTAGNSYAATLWMTDDDLRATFTGQKIMGHYTNGKKFNEEFRRDGTLTYIDVRRQNTGRWSISNDSFCTIYDADPLGGCYQVARVGSNCFEFYFIARTKQQAEKPEDRTKPSWTARAWLSQNEPTCEDESFV